MLVAAEPAAPISLFDSAWRSVPGHSAGLFLSLVIGAMMTVKLTPMDVSYYEQWMTTAIQEYAADKVRAGSWPAESAEQRSADTFRKLLPDGVRSQGHHLFTIEADGQPVGMIWFAEINRADVPKMAWIFDFRIDEAHRRHGYGYQAMIAVEAEVRAVGIDQIGLHVFGHNHAAQALYEKAGYTPVSIEMAKQI